MCDTLLVSMELGRDMRERDERLRTAVSAAGAVPDLRLGRWVHASSQLRPRTIRSQRTYDAGITNDCRWILRCRTTAVCAGHCDFGQTCLRDKLVRFTRYCRQSAHLPKHIFGTVHAVLHLQKMSQSMLGHLGAPKHVPTCALNTGHPARSAALAHTHARAHRRSASRSSRQQKALDAWILHAVRSDKQDTQVDSSVLQLISDLTNKVDQEHAAILSENEPRPEGMADEPSEGLRLKVEQSIQKLQKGLLERETEVPLRPNNASHYTHAMFRQMHVQTPQHPLHLYAPTC